MPDDYEELNKIYDGILDRHFDEIMNDYGLGDLVDLKNIDRESFEDLRERGRRIVFDENISDITILKDCIMSYEKESQRSAENGSYLAAIISIAAALEGILIIKCLNSIELSINKLKEISNKPIKNKNPMDWKFETLIKVCSSAGFFDPVNTGMASFCPRILSDSLRKMRNYVHPSRMMKDRAWVKTTNKEYQFYKSIYILLSKDFMG